MLVVVCGLPGVGKTTVAERATERVDGELLRTDVVRKDVLPDPEYTDEEQRIVYRELFERGEAIIEGGGNVVLDGTFQDAPDRERARALADGLDVEFRLVKVECDVDVVERRIASRTHDESDADFEIHLMYRDLFDPVADAHAVIDNSGELGDVHEQLDAALPPAEPNATR